MFCIYIFVFFLGGSRFFWRDGHCCGTRTGVPTSQRNQWVGYFICFYPSVICICPYLLMLCWTVVFYLVKLSSLEPENVTSIYRSWKKWVVSCCSDNPKNARESQAVLSSTTGCLDSRSSFLQQMLDADWSFATGWGPFRVVFQMKSSQS